LFAAPHAQEKETTDRFYKDLAKARAAQQPNGTRSAKGYGKRTAATCQLAWTWSMMPE
jgi:hypothetical protein